MKAIFNAEFQFIVMLKNREELHYLFSMSLPSMPPASHSHEAFMFCAGLVDANGK